MNELDKKQKTGKILLVDDEEIIHLTLKRLFSHEDYFIDHAYSGSEALEKLNETYDLVICDVIMPGMNGITVLKEVHKRKYKAEVIMLSGFAGKEHEEEAKANKVSHFFYKPIDDIISFKNAVSSVMSLER